jgi:hypothetical protein
LSFTKSSRLTRYVVVPFLRNAVSYGYALWTYWNHVLAIKDGAYRIAWHLIVRLNTNSAQGNAGRPGERDLAIWM